MRRYLTIPRYFSYFLRMPVRHENFLLHFTSCVF